MGIPGFHQNLPKPPTQNTNPNHKLIHPETPMVNYFQK